MRCFITLITIWLLVSLTSCDDQRTEQGNKVRKKATDVRKERKKSDSDTSGGVVNKVVIGKRHLNGQLFRVPKGNAYSYTHVVQTHGPVRKVVHSSEPAAAVSSYTDDQGTQLDSNEGNDLYGYVSPTKEPFHAPVFVTARPVLPLARPESHPETLHTHQDRLIPFAYPLFRPYYDNVLHKQYSVPVQVVYRLPPYQRAFDYQSWQNPYAVDLQTNYKQLLVERPFAYTHPVQRPGPATELGLAHAPYYYLDTTTYTNPNPGVDEQETTPVKENAVYNSQENDSDT